MPFRYRTLVRRAAGLEVAQYLVPGHLTMGTCGLVFAFKVDKHWLDKHKQPEPPEMYKPVDTFKFNLIKCLSATTPPAPALLLPQEANCAREQLDPDRLLPNEEAYEIMIPYRNINVLARARTDPTGETSTTTAFAAFTAGIAEGLFNLKSHNGAYFGSGAVGLLGLVYYFDFVRAAQSSNYMVLFVCPKDEDCSEKEKSKNNIQPGGNQPCQDAKLPCCQNPPPGSQQPASQSVFQNCQVNINQTAPAPDDLFAKGDVITFRILNYHDYYNISMILNGKTGMTFVTQNAEKPGK